MVPSLGNHYPPKKRSKGNELNSNSPPSLPRQQSGAQQQQTFLIAASTPGGGGSWQKPPRKSAAERGEMVPSGTAIFVDPSGKFLTFNAPTSSCNGATALVLPNKVQNGIFLAKSSGGLTKSGNVISGQQSVVLGCVGTGNIGKTVIQSEGSSNCTLVPTGPAAFMRVPISSAKQQTQQHTMPNSNFSQHPQHTAAPHGCISLTTPPRNPAQQPISYHQLQSGLAHQQVHISRQQPQSLS